MNVLYVGVRESYYMKLEDEYQEIIKKCKFISKSDEWFVEGTEAKLDIDVTYPRYNSGDKFNSIIGLFNGLTYETYLGGYNGELPREDGETCPFDEFFIYDEYGNEISELTLEEYKQLLRKKKLNNINETIRYIRLWSRRD